MSTVAPSQMTPPWYETQRFRQWVIAGLIVFLLGQAIVSVFFRYNDCGGHIDEGKKALNQGLHAVHWVWYPLGRMAFNSGISLLGAKGAKIFLYVLSIWATVACFRMWNQMAQGRVAVSWQTAFAAAFFAFLGTFMIVQRDLDECGLHILLMFVLTSAAWHLWRGHSVRSGFWLAAAITYKTTPLLFLPYLVWKRQWKVAAYAGAFVLVLNMSPAVIYGWDSTLEYHRRWVDASHRSATMRDPCENICVPPQNINQSWNTTVARLVQTYPPDHPLYLDHPLFMQFGNLDVDSANRAVKIATLLLIGVMAWLMRRPWASSAHMACEWAVVMLLAALLSPFCWKHHLVASMAVLFLAIRDQLAHGFQPRWRTVAIVTFAVIEFAASRGVLGNALGQIALSYKAYTIAAFLAIYLALSLGYDRAVEQTESHGASGSEDRPRIAA